MRGEELEADPAFRRLLGHRLGAVLAELGELAVLTVGGLGLRPRAARAVEALALVEQPQGADGPAGPICSTLRSSDTATPGTPAAQFFGRWTSSSDSSMSSVGAERFTAAILSGRWNCGERRGPG